MFRRDSVGVESRGKTLQSQLSKLTGEPQAWREALSA